MRAPIVALLVGLVVSGPAAARAQSDECGVPPDETADQVAQQASDHYERGSVLYFQGDYEGAVREYHATLCLLPSATDVLYSIGQAYERLLDFEQAIAFYQRYVDAKKDATGADATERKSIESRITVLEGLPARVQITTDPAGADISFTDDGGTRRALGKATEKAFELRAGTYTMRVELAGFVVKEETIQPRIGQSYSYFEKLEPQTGHLVINAEPPDSRIFVDDRLVGIGRYEADLPGDTYDVTVEASNRISERRRVKVVAERKTDLPVKLSPKPSSGRTQMLVGASFAGAVLGGVALVPFDAGPLAGLGAVGGLGLGFAGAYFGVPHDITIGESSYIITSGLVGAFEAGFIAGIFIDTRDAPDIEHASLATATKTVSEVTAGGLAVGALFGAATATRFELDAGDAALLNSGALWGGIGGGLFASIFQFQPRISEGLVLGGMNLGIVTSVLLGRRVTISRGHAALIDLAGFAGMGIAVATASAIDQAYGNSGNGERTAHFALGGMAAGLAAGAYLTRHLDTPKTHVTPTLTGVQDAGGKETAILGFGGQF
jgi:hypothetical protein